MFGFLKKKGCQLQHFKKAGYSFPENMKLVLRFDRHPHKWGHLGYGIYQCSGCGKRAFSSSACLIEPTEFEKSVDDFISYKIELSDLLKVFEKYQTHFEIKGE